MNQSIQYIFSERTAKVTKREKKRFLKNQCRERRKFFKNSANKPNDRSDTSSTQPAAKTYCPRFAWWTVSLICVSRLLFGFLVFCHHNTKGGGIAGHGETEATSSQAEKQKESEAPAQGDLYLLHLYLIIFFKFLLSFTCMYHRPDQ